MHYLFIIINVYCFA